MTRITDKHSFVTQLLPPPWRSTDEKEHPFQVLAETLFDPAFENLYNQIHYARDTIRQAKIVSGFKPVQDEFMRVFGPGADIYRPFRVNYDLTAPSTNIYGFTYSKVQFLRIDEVQLVALRRAQSDKPSFGIRLRLEGYIFLTDNTLPTSSSPGGLGVYRIQGEHSNLFREGTRRPSGINDWLTENPRINYTDPNVSLANERFRRDLNFDRARLGKLIELMEGSGRFGEYEGLQDIIYSPETRTSSHSTFLKYTAPPL